MKEWIIFKSNPKKPESEIVYNILSLNNKKTLDNWLYEKSIKSKSEKRAGNRKRTILKLFKFLNKDWDKITYDDYVSVASAIANSKNGVKQKNSDRYFISRFLKDNFEDWEKKFKMFELLSMEQEGEDKKLSPKELLTELEIDKLMKTTSDMKKISLIAVLSMSAGRPEEIVKLKWCDVDFVREQIYLYSGKTKKRRAVYIGSAINHLIRLKKEMNSLDDDLIFPAKQDKIMKVGSLSYMLQEMGKEAGIKKRIFPYLFRHTRLSFLITKLSPKVYEEVAGHSLQMGMKTYAHLSQDKIIKEMKEKVFDVEELSPEEKDVLEKRIEELEKGFSQIYSAITGKKIIAWANGKLKVSRI